MTYFTPAQQVQDVKLERLSIDEGLSNNQVHFIFQDQTGFVWIGTLSGLNRYDGYELKTYFHDDKDSTTLKGNTVTWMSEGPHGHLWVKNNSGVSAYDPHTDRFTVPAADLELLQTGPAFITKMIGDRAGGYWFVIENRGLVLLTDSGQKLEANNTELADIKIASSNVTDMALDEAGQLWLVHATGMIEVINISSRKVVRKFGLPDDMSAKLTFWNIYVDLDQDVWLYSLKDPFGAYYLNTQTGASRLYEPPQISANMVTGIVQTEDGKVWIGADHGGVTILRKNSWEMTRLRNDPDDPSSLISDNVNTIYKDVSGGVWIGSTKSGVNYFHPSSSTFNHYKYTGRKTAFNDMSSFAQDQNGDLWIGTNGQGLLKFCLKTHEFKQTSDLKGPKPKVIVSLLYDSKGVLWIGTYLDGLYQLRDGQFIKVDLGNKAPLLSVWELFEDSQHNMWVGTLNMGVYCYNPKTGALANYNMSNGLRANYVTTITEDKSGRVWLGTGDGLSSLSLETHEITTYVKDTNPDNAVSDNSVISLLYDEQNRLWIGTLDGLNVLNLNTMKFTKYGKREGLSSNIVMSIEQDDDLNFWVSSDHGLTKMTRDGSGFLFHNFTSSDGLQADNFTEDASMKTRDGRLIFSGQNGFNIFPPRDIEISKTTPDIFFTGFTVNSSPVVLGEEYHGHVLLEKPLNETTELDLRYDENSVSFEYVALSFFQSGKIRYQYILEGFDKEWVSAPAEMRRINYTNLDYGHYTFKVRASTGPNSWTEPIALELTIKPPFWETPWAFLIYAVMVVLVLHFTRSFIVQRERQKANVENERREVERQHQLDMMKIKFFTNISHEFRTPLSLVLTPIERMLKHPEQIKKGDLVIVQRNAKRLMTLVNQLLDFRKMEANQHTLHQSSGDIIVFMQDIVDSFSDLSREKDIPLIFDSEIKSYYTFFDRDKMEKIMFNLLSNAFKFTLPGGKITVDFELQRLPAGNRAQIMVSDTGIGIPEEKHELIFNRFFQNEVSGDIINNGSGIGLSITKEFVELHHGTITVDSKPNIGSTFTVDVPLKEISTDEDMADELVKELTESISKPDLEPEPYRRELPTVLLVEDNFDFRFYLKDNLKQYYNILVASNGKEAWKTILNENPDIIISDVMMPVMDGLELCEKLKADPRTLHIPVILLTAQSSDRHRIQGLEAGAIEYISKPFNFEILISSINSALKFQKRVKESGKQIEASPSEVEVASVDEQLIARAVLIVEENMSNSEFSVEDLSHELGYSRGHFYQKILRLTGQTPIDFIRSIRMKRAADLLQKSQLNVSEVAYKVGYNNPKLFSRYFKSFYQMYPSEFRGKSESSAEGSDKA